MWEVYWIRETDMKGRPEKPKCRCCQNDEHAYCGVHLFLATL